MSFLSLFTISKSINVLELPQTIKYSMTVRNFLLTMCGLIIELYSSDNQIARAYVLTSYNILGVSREGTVPHPAS